MMCSKIVFVDFCKAFDIIGFNILRQKLQELHFS